MEMRKGICHECGYRFTEEELNKLRMVAAPKCPRCTSDFKIIQCTPNKHKYRIVIDGPPCPTCGSWNWQEDCFNRGS